MAGRAPANRGRGGRGGAGRRGDGWWPPSVPIPVEGGLQARSTRGKIGDTWWSQRFIAVLESFGIGSRLQRGKRYARSGQVLSMEVGAGHVTASVQGSRSRPYRVFIEARVLTDREWDDVEAVMTSRAVFMAKLLAGEMPEEIEEAFAATSSSLFPSEGSDVETACSCPDWENPCKHIAAVFYLLAEAFDRDPFLIFAWRGRDKDTLLASLRARRRQGRDGGPGEAAGPPVAGGDVHGLAGEPERFGWPEAGAPHPGAPVPASVWGEGAALGTIGVRYHRPVAPDLVLRRLDPAPLGDNADRIVAELGRAYAEITAAAAALALGGADEPGSVGASGAQSR